MKRKYSHEKLQQRIAELERQNAALDEWIFDADLEPDPAKALAVRAAREVARYIYEHVPVMATDPFDFERHINRPMRHLNSLEARLSYLEEELGVKDEN